MGVIDYIILAAYMIGMLVIGFVARGRINNMDDFILGGRRFGRMALIGTILATMIGSGMTMGTIGDAYMKGATGTAPWVYIGFATGLIVMGFMSRAMRKTGARSIAEIIAKAFGAKARFVMAIAVIAYAVSLVAINIAGLRTIIITVFGEHIALSIPAATAIAAAIAITYTALGGFYAVVWTDVAQLFIMIAGVFIIGPVIGISMVDGGLGTVTHYYTDQGMSLFNPVANGFSSGSLGFLLAYFLASPGDPTMPQRALSAKSNSVSKFSFITSGLIAYYFGFALLVIGGSCAVLMPGLENPDRALPSFVLAHYPIILKGITIAGLVAAIMSSFDSFLILSTTHIMYDIGRVVKPDLKDRTITRAMPILTIIIGAIGIIVALFISSLLSYLSVVFSIIGSAAVPATVAALYFPKRCSKWAVTIGIAAGGLVPTVLFFTRGYDVPLGDPVFMGLLASAACIVIFSFFLKDKPTQAELNANMHDVDTEPAVSAG